MSTASEEPRVVAGRYRLSSVLGSGSMGTVWAAYDEFLQRPVAVKEIKVPPGVTAGQADELRERTLREARAIAVLSHPNVIVLHDVARENDEPFVVMELLQSHSLAELIREHGPLSVEQAAAVGDAVAAALEAAHDAGITHRDVKPGNVLVAEDGRIKLTDFGIARNVSEATMTRTGMTLGSPAYMSPEVASGKAVTPGADLWGLGATLFNAVEGHPPYDADGDPMETMGKVVKGEVPRPTPGPLAAVITGLMAKEPRDRMPLRAVRQQLYPMVKTAPRVLFAAEMFSQAAGRRAQATDTREIAPAAPPLAAQSGEASQELAAEPGPLPFMTGSTARPTTTGSTARPPVQPPPPPAPTPAAASSGRGVTATAVLISVSILLFLASAAGGFVAARVIGAESIKPPQQTNQGALTEPAPTRFETRTGDASNVKGDKAATFTVDVPSDWTRFTGTGVGDNLPPSTLVRWVSPDGSQMLAVDHISGYFPNYSIEQYVRGLSNSRGPGSFTQTDSDSLKDGRDGIAMTYRTFDTGTAGNKVSRTTFAQIFKSGTSLWAVSVTVPTEQENTAKTELWQRIAPTFKLAG
ncbi:serine/threonine protein kinase [Amycolatopsis acidicola]|uniref:non-specific serine/threonine protein kinase n=1 Tax=Amycolatopsis acidicola TaxID=2596893 RepID=A0A5N0UJ14_9PSEU|nr:serine/threonine-protein kinase [Amycolatopsis acidicola]KAA9148990.1 serine/threonine protein kinase [Amycolatopsis acidicola]